MGMDVYGKKPSGKDGEYFRNNVWWWRPLWNYCESVAPEVASKVENGHSNDGDGLNAADSIKLAEILEKELESGRTEQFSRKYAKELRSLPEEKCEICGGTGHRAVPPAIGPGTDDCNGCNGKGTRPSFATSYPFSVDSVREFAKFLRQCGGFEIC